MEYSYQEQGVILLEAEKKAFHIFKEAESRGLITAGSTELELNNAIYSLAFELYGINKFWHKRIVRSGENTLFPYRENPPNRIIEEDDILFFDFGPVFEEWEADVGMTFVVGSDPIKLKLKNDVQSIWELGKAWYLNNLSCNGSELYAHTCKLAKEMGWEFGGPHCGHLIGRFPHERIEGEEKTNYLHPDNAIRIDALGKSGEKRHWIYEVHLVDHSRKIGAFHEAILTS